MDPLSSGTRTSDAGAGAAAVVPPHASVRAHAGPAAPAPGAARAFARRIPSVVPAALFWTAYAVVAGLNTWLSMRDHGHSAVRLVLFQFAAALPWVLATPAIAWLVRRRPLVPWSARAMFVHAVAGLAMTAVWSSWVVAMTGAIQPFAPMTQTLPPFPDFLLVRLTAGLLVYCGTVAVLHAVAFHQRAARAAELERELARARLDALAAQVQPHFLFNALHTVGALVRTGESQKAVATLAGISDLLRYALDGSGVAEVSVREEIEIARRYLEIQSLRYGERLAVRFAVADDALDAGVPRLILQPLLENAIRHGVARGAGPAWIEVSASRADERLRVAVRNNAPLDLAADPGAGIGLRTTRARLEQLHGSAFRMETGRTGDAYDAVIEIPWRPAGDVRSRG